MIVVIGRQLYLEDFRYVTCQMRHIGARVALLVFDVLNRRESCNNFQERRSGVSMTSPQSC